MVQLELSLEVSCRTPTHPSAAPEPSAPASTMIQPSLSDAAPAAPSPLVAQLSPPVTAVLPVNIAEVMALLPAVDGLSLQRRSGMMSALRKISRLAGKRPEDIPASATSLRMIFANSSPATAGVSKARWDNLRSLSLDALRQTGLPALQSRAQRPLSLAWEALRDKVPDIKFRAGLSRFMSHCSMAEIAPDQVTESVVDAYIVALQDGTLTRNPKQVFRTTCVLWNRAVGEIEGWPSRIVPVPSHSRRYALNGDAFPESFQADVHAFLTRSGSQDPFADDYAPSVKPSTIAMRRKQISQMATALAKSGVDMAAITSLAALVETKNAKRLLRFLYDRHNEPSVYLYQQANLLKTIARYWVRAPASQIDKIAVYAKNLAVKRSFMTPKNMARLRQFDNHENVLALLNLPQRVFADVLRNDPGTRVAALRIMMAVAVELLIVAPMRIDSLVGLEPERHFVEVRRGKSTVTHLVIPAKGTKTDVPFEVELPAETARLVAIYRRDFLPRLADSPGPWLFPSDTVGRRNTASMAVAIGRFIERETGLKMNVHLFRHLAVKLLLDAYPDDIETARRLLGHKSSSTTSKAYAEFKTSAAFKRYDGVVARLRGVLPGDTTPPPHGGRRTR